MLVSVVFELKRGRTPNHLMHPFMKPILEYSSLILNNVGMIYFDGLNVIHIEAADIVSIIT